MSEIQQLEEENIMGFGAEDTNNLLDNPNLAAAMKKMLELQLQVMVIPIVKRIVGPIMENMVRKVVKEEFERAQENFFTREKWKSGDEGHINQVRQLELRFLEQVPDLVYTGKEIKREGGNYLRVALVDPRTGSHVSAGPEASAEVELRVLSKDDDDDDVVDGNFRQEETEDSGRPLLSQNHVKMKDGVALLDYIKFKHKRKWTKSSKVILVARANLHDVMVKDAATEPFHVMDFRSTLYKKRYPPALSDEVWRLKEISRGSLLHKHLINANVKTVVEFLRLLNMNPESLKQILNVSAEKFKIIVDHAKTCLIGENLYLYNSSSCTGKVRAVFNVVGCLRGLLYEDEYVPIDKLSEDEKVDANKIIASAFLHLDDAEPIENEAFIPHFLSQSSNANGANTSSSPRSKGADGSNVSPMVVVPAFDVESIENEASISHLPPGSSNANGSNTSSSPRTENASGSNFSPEIVVPTFEDVEPNENEASTSYLAPGSSKANGANISTSPRTENAAGGNFSLEIVVPAFQYVQPIGNDASVAHLASGSFNANAADIPSTSRPGSVPGSNFGIWKTNDESENALPSTVPRHLSRVYSFGGDPFDEFDFFLANNMEILGPIHSRSTSEEFGENVQLFGHEHYDLSTTAGGMQMTGIHIPSSGVACRRWRRAIRIVALVDMQARKKRRLKEGSCI